ncbi:MAG: hypothetical protein HRT57_13225 [Crocinitomicaceae bacterium]|nr:hypothetical protein [Crocinitomicaceae bacterium]
MKTSEAIDKTKSWRLNPEWINQYSDKALCSDQKGTIKKANEHSQYIYTGQCKDGKVSRGKMYFYDSDNTLLRVENWKEGEFVKTVVLD